MYSEWYDLGFMSLRGGGAGPTNTHASHNTLRALWAQWTWYLLFVYHNSRYVWLKRYLRLKQWVNNLIYDVCCCRSWSFRLVSTDSPPPRFPPPHPPHLWTPRPCSPLHYPTRSPPPPPLPPPWWLPLWVWMPWTSWTWMSLREPPLSSPQTWCLTWGWQSSMALEISWWMTGEEGKEGFYLTPYCPVEPQRPAAGGAASAWMRTSDDISTFVGIWLARARGGSLTSWDFF